MALPLEGAGTVNDRVLVSRVRVLEYLMKSRRLESDNLRFTTCLDRYHVLNGIGVLLYYLPARNQKQMVGSLRTLVKGSNPGQPETRNQTSVRRSVQFKSQPLVSLKRLKLPCICITVLKPHSRNWNKVARIPGKENFEIGLCHGTI